LNNSKTPMSRQMNDGNDNLEFGSYGAGTARYGGTIDASRIFTTYLNDTCIAKLYNRTLEGEECVFTDGVGDVTPPSITDINCTSPEPHDTAATFWTSDPTPTFSLKTDENANCYISNINSSYWNCTTTGSTTAHICTINATQTLNESYVNVYFNCTDGSNSQTYVYQTYVDSVNPDAAFNSPASQTYTDGRKWISLSTIFSDTTNVNNITLYVNSTLNITNSSPVNNSAWVYNLTVSDYTNYTMYFTGWDNVSTYNSNSTETRWFNFEADTCVCTDGFVWAVSMPDSCSLTTDCIPTSVNLTGQGLLVISANLTTNSFDTVESGQIIHVKNDGGMVHIKG